MKIKDIKEATETTIADMIITQYELGQLTYEEAREELKKHGLDVWIHELNMAAELKDDKAKMH